MSTRRLSDSLLRELRGELLATRRSRGMSLPAVAREVGIPFGSLKSLAYPASYPGRAVNVEWCARLAAWCGLGFAILPGGPPDGVDDAGEPEGDEGDVPWRR